MPQSTEEQKIKNKLVNEIWRQADAHGVERVREYLKKNAIDIDVLDGDGATALVIACSRGMLKSVQVLVELGASTNRVSGSSYIPLNSAGISGSNEIVTFLIKSGAEVNAQFDSGGRYVLSHLCHFAPLPETIALLLQAGANPNCVDDTGTSPLVVTAFSREDAIGVEIMKHLVKHGARVDTKDCEGRTALDVAAERGHLLQVAFLKRDNQGITRRIFGSLFD